MRTLARIGVVAAGMAWASGGYAQPDAAHALVGVKDDRPFALRDGRGRYLALHFMSRTDVPQSIAFVKEYVVGAPGVAGVRHLFVVSGEAEAAKAWSVRIGEDAGVFVDRGRDVAKDLKVAQDPSAAFGVVTVVIDPAGKELFRLDGKERTGFAGFAKAMEERSVRPALSDYNVPRRKPLAVEGYDVVGYFVQGAAVMGVPELTSKYRGIAYQFSSEANRKLFVDDPEKYLPAYGGWCARAMGNKGSKIEIEPTNFKVKDGRLFLFYNGTFSNALPDWNKHEKEWEPAADAHWKRLTREEPVRR